MTAPTATTPGPEAPDGSTPEEGRAAAPPAVLAVVVAHGATEHLERTLRALGAQEYSNLSVVVVDAASPQPIAGAVAAVLPDARVHRLGSDLGFGAAAEAGRRLATDARFVLLCHDDVVPRPDAVSLLVAEAFRSNAGIVGPKLVDDEQPRLLRSVGYSVDRTGVVVPVADHGEIDQAQHDAVRDVFGVSDACLLVRTDLLTELGGFDEQITFHGGDLDLCWRAHVAGARVVVAPAATVGHREGLALRRPDLSHRRLALRHAMRTRRSTTRLAGRVRVGVAAAVFAVFEVLGALLSGHWGHARDVVAAYWWNARHRGGIRRKRRAVERTRRLSDAEVRRLQVRGTSRALTFFRRQVQRGDDRLLADAGRPRLPGMVRGASLRTAALVLSATAVVLVAGSRVLLVDGVPAVGSMQPLPGDAGVLLEQFRSGWRSSGLGSTYAAPSAFAALGGATAVVLGAVGLLRSVLLLGMLPLGILGAWHLTVPIGSRRARLAGVLTYAAVPVGIDALATGRWGGLVAYGLAPWLVSILARGSGVAPFGPLAPDPDTSGRVVPLKLSVVRQALAAGLVAALVAMLSPVAVGLPVAVAGVLVVGGLLVGQVRGSVRLLVTGAVGSAVAAALHLPVALAAADDPDWATLVGTWLPAPDRTGAGSLLRFETGPHGGSVLLYGLLVAAALGLVIGRRWRLAWSVRGWCLLLAGWAPLWLAARGDLTRGLPDPEVLLAPAAAGLVLAVAMSVAAFEVDLSNYRFGWRQAASAGATAAFAVAMLPVLGSAASGTWGLPDRDFVADFASLDARAGDEPYRVVWLGAPDVLPVAAWQLAGQPIDPARGDDRPLHMGVTEGVVPDAADTWIAPPSGATDQLAAVVGAGLAGDTSRLGSLLAPMGVRYVVVVDRPAPAPYVADPVAPAPGAIRALERQLDLLQIDLNSAVRVYENDVRSPVRALLPTDVELPGDALARGGVPELAGAATALPEAGVFPSASGSLEPGTLWVAEGYDPRWELRVGDEAPEAVEAAGWATTFDVDVAGPATLDYRTPASRTWLVVAQVALWAAVLAALAMLRSRHLRREARHREDVDRARAAEAAVLAAAGRASRDAIDGEVS